ANLRGTLWSVSFFARSYRKDHAPAMKELFERSAKNRIQNQQIWRIISSPWEQRRNRETFTGSSLRLTAYALPDSIPDLRQIVRRRTIRQIGRASCRERA